MVAKSIALGNRDEFRAVLARGMRLALALTIPSSVGLIMLARPIISLIYEHGKVTAYQTDQSAAALRFYALGLVAYSAMKVLAPAFYAIDKRKTPMIVSFAAIGVNLLLNWIFTFRMNLGHRGLALSTGGVATINFVVLYLLMRRETGALETRQMCSVLVKLLIASAALGAVCGAAQIWVLSTWAQHAFVWKAAMLFATITAAGAIFFLVARLLRIEELDEFTDVVRRKLGRRHSRP